jgi:hypothetical protein
MNNIEETLIPKIGVITDVRIDTPDIKTFRVVTPEGKNQKGEEYMEFHLDEQKLDELILRLYYATK